MILHSYWRSTTSYRVRAALNLKGVAYSQVAVDLVAGGQRRADYAALNPGLGVPTLVLDDGTALTQSMAILDYLDAAYPDPPLLPQDPINRARVRAAAHGIALDIHPLNNLRVISQLKSRFNATPEDTKAWMLHWITEGFAALETMLPDNTTFAFTDQPGLADLCIVAQTYNARRWGMPLTSFPNITRVEAACLATPEIAAARPEAQPDAP